MGPVAQANVAFRETSAVPNKIIVAFRNRLANQNSHRASFVPHEKKSAAKQVKTSPKTFYITYPDNNQPSVDLNYGRFTSPLACVLIIKSIRSLACGHQWISPSTSDRLSLDWCVSEHVRQYCVRASFVLSVRALGLLRFATTLHPLSVCVSLVSGILDK